MMTKVEKLDKYLSTDDKGFNELMQSIIVVHTRSGEVVPNDYVIEYMDLINQIYSFYIQNSTKPIACLDYFVKEGKKIYSLPEQLVMLADSILRLLYNRALANIHSDHIRKAMILLTNYRHELSPFSEEPIVSKFCPEFNYDMLQEELDKMSELGDKIELLKGRLRLLRAKWRSLDELEQGFIEETAFKVRCINEIERLNQIVTREGKTAEDTNKSKQSAATKSERVSPERVTNNYQGSPLSIAPASRQALYDDLKLYVECNDKNEAPELHALIFDKIKPKEQIVVTCLAREFGLTFYEARAITGEGAKLLSEQLPLYFVRYDGKELVQFSPSNLVKYLRGKDKDK